MNGENYRGELCSNTPFHHYQLDLHNFSKAIVPLRETFGYGIGKPDALRIRRFEIELEI